MRWRAPIDGVEAWLDRSRAWPVAVVDAALAVVVGTVTLVAVVVRSGVDEPLTPLGVALVGVQVVPLAWRRQAPVVVGVVTAAASIAYGTAELPDPPVMFAPLLATYTVAAYRPRAVSVPGRWWYRSRRSS